MKSIIYLDYNATTPIDKEVSEAMQPYLAEYFGNASSRYRFGYDSRKAVEAARASVATLIGASAEEIIFTSGGSESDNHALKGVAFAHRNRGNHIVVSSVEHPAVLQVCDWLQKQGFRISYLPVSQDGVVNPADLESVITPATILVSVMHSNNEVGAIQPIRELSAIAHRYGALFHTDAAQSAGKIRIDVNELDVDLLTLAGHKFYGPKGIGALFVRKGTEIEQLIHGASQERNQRAGTENLLEIVGMGKAAEIALRDLDANSRIMKLTRNHLAERLVSKIVGIHINGNPSVSLPNTLSVAFAGITADTLLSAMPGLALSAGAACHADGVSVSHVLDAMHVEKEFALGTIRFSTGKYTTIDEIDTAADTIVRTYNSLKGNAGPHQHQSGNHQVRLTEFTHGLGCGCKLKPSQLDSVLRKLPQMLHHDLLVGTDTSDDAAVYRISDDNAVVQTVDFFTPVVDDPYDFGAIAAANALSDIYAMGARPLFALNIVAFPVNRLPITVLDDILRGAADKAAEAGIVIAGGHSIEDNEPKFGMCVTGIVNPERIWKNFGAQPGDSLILTKPLGTGILSTAIKNGQADEITANEAIASMKQLNRAAYETLLEYEVHACTDITGFGLAGHLAEMVLNSQVNAELWFDQLPFFKGTKEVALAGAIPGGTAENMNYFRQWIKFEIQLSEVDKLMLADAQTSGGLLVAMAGSKASEALARLKQNGVAFAKIIGQIVEGKGFIHIK